MKAWLSVILAIVVFIALTVPSHAQVERWQRYYDITPDDLDENDTYQGGWKIGLAPDGGMYLQGQFSTNINDLPYYAYVMRIDSQFNLEWARSYDPPPFFQTAFTVLPNGKFLTAGRQEISLNIYQPFIALMDEYGNPLGSLTFASGNNAQVTDMLHVSMAGGYAALVWNGGPALNVKRFSPTGQQLWTVPVYNVQDPGDSRIFELPGGDIAITLSMADQPVIATLDQAAGQLLHQFTFDPGDGAAYDDAVMTDDGSFFIKCIIPGNHKVIKVEPPYDQVAGEVLTGHTFYGFASTSDGGFITSGAFQFRKFSSDLVQEIDFHTGEQYFSGIIEYQPGEYACGSGGSRGLSDETDTKLVMIGTMPEPEPTALDVYLYQEWDEDFYFMQSDVSVSFTETVTNTWDSPVTVDRWEQVSLPNGSMMTFEPTEQTYTPGGFHLTDYTINVPPGAPMGNYAFIVNLGTYPNDIMTTSSMIFRKIPGMTVPALFPPMNPDAVNNDPTVTARDENESNLPGEFALGTAWPNPFNASTVLTLALPETGEVKIVVTDILGRQVAVVREGVLPAGDHRIVFAADDMASGMYFVRAFDHAGHSAVRKVLLVR
ncbi:T9SS type A sorting domain-containing protein [bacterium]|nr:T9SS type A sorting domain-containing protein [bacterium]